jgi:hypothetical protein
MARPVKSYWIDFERYDRLNHDFESDRMQIIRKTMEQNDGKLDRPQWTGWCLADPAHAWFGITGIDYLIFYDHTRSTWQLGVDDPNHFMLVKLAWML